MQIQDMNWMQVEAYLQQDDRAVVPLGSTEQHAYLRLSVDSILAERVAVEAAAPLGIPVFPVLSYGITPYFTAYPGTVSLRISTYLALVEDVVNSLAHSGFRRILLVNGHGGNEPAGALATEWMAAHPTVRLRFHSWWKAPRTWARVQEIDPAAGHASWMENFPWTRLPGVVMPAERKVLPPRAGQPVLVGAEARAFYGDGSFGGLYQRADDEMRALWRVAVEETRAQMETGWT